MILVFSDLDGTLLDHDSYSFEAAKPALALLAQRKIPVILASSKTEAEMRPIAQAMGLSGPMIVENGAGIVAEGTGAPMEGPASDHEALLQTLRQLPKYLQACFEGFSDWTIERVAAETGLALDAAARAKARRFSEPGRFSGTEAEKREFLRLLEEGGFTAVEGGRFLTLMPKTSKAKRMAEVADRYARESRGPVKTLALGDAMNDLAMLEAADCGAIIANPAHAPLPVTQRERDGLILRSTETGPSGWNQIIQQLVQSGFF